MRWTTRNSTLQIHPRKSSRYSSKIEEIKSGGRKGLARSFFALVKKIELVCWNTRNLNVNTYIISRRLVGGKSAGRGGDVGEDSADEGVVVAEY
jgi:hypothetical protein